MNNPFEVIEARLNNIETLLLDLKHAPKKQGEPTAETERWFDLNELCTYIPDKPSKPTVYGWVNAGSITVHKGGKKLRFLKSEIDSWLKQGRRKTLAEITSEAEANLKRKGGKNA
jgi:excisionase family DNA binding protein